MSNKRFDNLMDADKRLRRMFPIGIRDEIDVVIRKRTGFELWNSRPYHNYETWSDGYIAETATLLASGEDLDECLDDLERLLAKERAGEEIPIWKRPYLWPGRVKKP